MSRTPTLRVPFVSNLTESSDAAFTSVIVPSGASLGGFIAYTVQANDASDIQTLTGFDTFSIVNKAGTLTVTLGTDTKINAVSAGTLTGTLKLVDSTGGVATFQMNAVSSLTQTALFIQGDLYLNQ